VPTLRGRSRTPDNLVASHEPRSGAAEALRVIRTSITLSSFDKPARALLVTSSIQEEGKSTVAANLATAFAESGVSTILVDLDLRRPSVAKIFNTRAEGLTNLLGSGAAMPETAAIATETPNLRILPTGPLPPMPAELLSSETMQSFMESLRSMADLVIVDTPPLLAVTDATIAATFCDAAVIVVRPDKVKRSMMTRSVELLSSTGIRIAGLVVNTLTPDAQRAYYSSYRQTHNYGHAYSVDSESPNGKKSGREDEVVGSLEHSQLC
jgi:capsular exopolysaccharide synthesis family protein